MKEPVRSQGFFYIAAICIFVLIGNVAVLMPVWAESREPCGPFHFSEMEQDAILSLYDDGLIQIKCAPEKGTGFVIDAEQGFVLTARHVVEPNLVKGEVINGTSMAQPDKLLEMMVHRDVKEYDIAVLRLIPKDALSGITALEISLDLPRQYSSVCTIGYQLGDTTPLPASGKICFDKKTGETQMRMDVFKGDSGSPVFDSHGLVFGIVIGSRYHDRISVISPLLYACEILIGLPTGQRAERLYSQLREGKIPHKQLMKPFDPVEKHSLTNLQLLSLIRELSQRKTLSDKMREFVKCPVYHAVLDRQLDEASTYLGPLLPKHVQSFEQARISLRGAIRRDRLGFSIEANALYDEATNGFEVAIGAQVAKNPEAILYGICKIAPDKMTEIEASEAIQRSFESDQLAWVGLDPSITQAVSPFSCEYFEGSPFLAGLVRDYSLSLYNKAKLAPKIEAQDLSERAGRAAALATIISVSGKPKAANLSLMGDALLQKNQYEMAAKAYAGAWQQGNTAKWVTDNYQAAITGGNLSLAARAIASAEAITDAAVAKYALGIQ